MNKRPWQLYVLSLSFLILLIVPFLRNIYWDSASTQFYMRANSMLLYDILVYSVSGLFGMALTLNASRESLIFLPMFWALATWEILQNFQAQKLPVVFSIALVAAGAFLILQLLWLTGSARRAVLNPGYCWWKQPLRKIVNAPAQVRTQYGKSFVSKVLNLSKNGALVDVKCSGRRAGNFRLGQLIDLRFLVGPLKVVKCRAEVVRQESIESGERYGVRIVDMAPDSKKKLWGFLNHGCS